MEITNRLVRRIIDSQFPQWRHLAIRSVEKSGHDNRTYRLGNEMTVRLPGHERYASAVEKELTWLPIFKPLLSLPIPVPIAKGEPTDEYPLPWSINRWIDVDTVTPNNIRDFNEFAEDLAGFLKELEAIDASRDIFLSSMNVDQDTVNRARGWALWKALITYGWNEKGSEASTWGKCVIDIIIRDYERR